MQGSLFLYFCFVSLRGANTQPPPPPPPSQQIDPQSGQDSYARFGGRDMTNQDITPFHYQTRKQTAKTALLFFSLAKMEAEDWLVGARGWKAAASELLKAVASTGGWTTKAEKVGEKVIALANTIAQSAGIMAERAAIAEENADDPDAEPEGVAAAWLGALSAWESIPPLIEAAPAEAAKVDEAGAEKVADNWVRLAGVWVRVAVEATVEAARATAEGIAEADDTLVDQGAWHKLWQSDGIEDAWKLTTRAWEETEAELMNVEATALGEGDAAEPRNAINKAELEAEAEAAAAAEAELKEIIRAGHASVAAGALALSDKTFLEVISIPSAVLICLAVGNGITFALLSFRRCSSTAGKESLLRVSS